jgi:DNA-binding NarL/FixJ family response regulator
MTRRSIRASKSSEVGTEPARLFAESQKIRVAKVELPGLAEQAQSLAAREHDRQKADRLTERVETASHFWRLTPRQTAVLSLLVQGLANKEIAARLDCSRRTVEAHISLLLAKARLQARAELIVQFWSGSF